MPRGFNRSERVAGQLRRELARLIQMEVKDPDLGLISVSDVEVSRDLSYATVFVTAYDESAAPRSIEALKRAGGYLRKRLGQELRIRSVPELRFRHDDSVERGQHMDRLIEQAVRSDRGPTEED
ncbi:MAG: 30S ribosome-binding factor RbfA [Xanthomonadales bacterium]|nr:30S ribosome-binding factor RbfA [Xanthomonadales bacterium]